ncbi:MAG: hypothetical protein Q8P62_01750 [Candidatus Peregrinibacteria bacterium]|nr:hypothetical protein [Candidatus Peregrinibacteria bacterium]
MLGLDTIKEAIGNPMDFIKKFGPSFSEAWKAASESKDKGWMDKIGIFFSKFSEEMAKLAGEKGDISKEAQDAAKKTTEEVIKDATTAVKLDETKVEKADADAYKEALVLGVTSKKALSPEQQIHAGKGLDKLTKAAKEGSTDRLDLDEFKAVAATALSTLKALKIKYPDKDKLAAALAQISKASDSSEYPIVGLLKTSVLKVLKPDFSSDRLKAKALAEAFGIDIEIDVIGGLSSLVGGKGSAVKSVFMDTMKLFQKESLTDDEKKQISLQYKKCIFPSTSEDSISKIVDFVHDMIQKKPDQLTTNQLAELVSLVDANDLDRMIGIFTGKTEGAANVA